MMNPATLMKIMSAKNKFTANHPKFVAFLKAAFGGEGCRMRDFLLIACW